MEILAGETSSYNLLSFISYKMELSWASTPVDINSKAVYGASIVAILSNLHKVVDSTQSFLKIKVLRIHDLRHVFASKMVMNDISARTVIKANGFYSGGNAAFISRAKSWDTGHIFFYMF